LRFHDGQVQAYLSQLGWDRPSAPSTGDSSPSPSQPANRQRG
jgi:hypothetical protein